MTSPGVAEAIDAKTSSSDATEMTRPATCVGPLSGEYTSGARSVSSPVSLSSAVSVGSREPHPVTSRVNRPNAHIEFIYGRCISMFLRVDCSTTVDSTPQLGEPCLPGGNGFCTRRGYRSAPMAWNRLPPKRRGICNPLHVTQV